NPNARFAGEGTPSSQSNYLGSAAPVRPWESAAAVRSLLDVPNYTKVTAGNLYDGVDLAYYSNQQGKLEFDFIVQPGSRPQPIQLDVQGAAGLQLDPQGNLLIDTAGGGRVVYQKPLLYQTADGARKDVAGAYTLLGGNRVGFAPGAYDVSKPLVIDPVLDYSTYLGGSGDDQGLGIAVDGAGNSYIVGKTLSTNFPVQRPFQSSAQGTSDVFVTKLNPAGNAIVYSTYVGGSGADQANGVAVDLAGNAYVVGTTASTNFPTTTGAYQTTLGGSTDAFVFQLSTSGDSLHYGTYVGGIGTDTGTAIAVDA